MFSVIIKKIKNFIFKIMQKRKKGERRYMYKLRSELLTDVYNFLVRLLRYNAPDTSFIIRILVL